MVAHAKIHSTRGAKLRKTKISLMRTATIIISSLIILWAKEGVWPQLNAEKIELVSTTSNSTLTTIISLPLTIWPSTETIPNLSSQQTTRTSSRLSSCSRIVARWNCAHNPTKTASCSWRVSFRVAGVLPTTRMQAALRITLPIDSRPWTTLLLQLGVKVRATMNRQRGLMEGSVEQSRHPSQPMWL